MPELPEVETIARTLAPQIADCRISRVSVLHPKVLQAGAERLPELAGARIARVFRRAKLLLLELESAVTAQPLLLAFHLKMTGRFFVHPAGTPPEKHTRLVFDLEEGGRVFFDDMRTFGYCRVMLPRELDQWAFWSSLGPEPLGLPAAELGRILHSAFCGRKAAVKGLLLDQRVVAGVGNIYADESLFRAGISPLLPAGELSATRCLALAGALQEILEQSIRECGSSIRDYRDALGNAGAFQNTFAVYGRKGESCRKCGAALEHARVAGRSTVYCPHCQI
ncbi:bifunctional DNA-formamidopyrimidine glycosylase/DNA-(apurinic or apyrimidinic site) lyase [Desulfovibrio sp. OttesenSCG-928-A18]|nr:bifunctional DNA-formamidopyrimidine glycosylase/DNA-(apurinic or apyrimidinic site) lyase [Desulfovibrio sp. OttesenSCG-928-A18]